MANNTIWIEKFKISSDLKAEFEKSSSSDKSFLIWCLENGHVNEREYLSWASEEFQLPVVSAAFFGDDDSLEKWRTIWPSARLLHTWEPSLLPLDESAGVFRVGCLEIPELKLEQPVAYVLAPLSGMKTLWSEAFPTVTSTAVAVMVEVTAPVADVPPPPPQEFDANSLMASWGSPEPESEVPAEPLPEVEELSPQMPEGFAMPEGFNAVDIPIPSMETITIPVVATPVVVEQAAPSPTIVVKAKPPIPPMAPATGKPTGDFIGLIELRNAKDKLDECQDLSEVANNAFSKFSRYFDRHMILMMKGFELRPHIWAGNWNLRSARPAGINLDQPSIFRTVSRTKLPYHGYTKPSASNDMFFGEWSNGVAPAHITVLPIVINDQLVGMFMGGTDGSLDAKVALMDAERWMDEITPHIGRTKSAPPKAA